MKRLPTALVALLALPLSSPAQPGAAGAGRNDGPRPARADFPTDIAPLLAKYCTGCHGGDSPKNDLSLEFGDERGVEQRLRKDRKVFERMAERVRLGEMPPPGRRARPGDEEKNALLTWIDRDVLGIGGARPGPRPVARVRRLTRVEYANTVRDLFSFKEFKPADELPADDSGYGFDNIPTCSPFRPTFLNST
jgi:mono/diheme cytochrome c family protein